MCYCSLYFGKVNCVFLLYFVQHFGQQSFWKYNNIKKQKADLTSRSQSRILLQKKICNVNGIFLVK